MRGGVAADFFDQRRRREEVGGIEVMYGRDDVSRVGCNGFAGVHVGHDGGHAERGSEQGEEGEGG